jgi:hypothetical protein
MGPRPRPDGARRVERFAVLRPGCAPPPQRGQSGLSRPGVPETTGVYNGAITPRPDPRELRRRVLAPAVLSGRAGTGPTIVIDDGNGGDLGEPANAKEDRICDISAY